jgi:hypothetical protein
MTAGMPMWAGIARVAALAALLLPPAATQARKPPCVTDCTPSDTSGCCPSCVADACSTFEACKDDINARIQTQYDACLEQVVTDIANLAPGRCALVRTMVQKCRDQRGTTAVCLPGLKQNIRNLCGDAGVGCRITTEKARRACRVCNGGSFVARSSPVGGSGEGSNPDDPNGCQQRCVNKIAGACFAQCNEACGGDGDALRVCRAGCRNQQCNELKGRCGCDILFEPCNAADHAYAACCLNQDTCPSELNFSCEQLTTTSTSTASTSSSTQTSTTGVTSSTTTTLIGG